MDIVAMEQRIKKLLESWEGMVAIYISELANVEQRIVETQALRDYIPAWKALVYPSGEAIISDVNLADAKAALEAHLDTECGKGNWAIVYKDAFTLQYGRPNSLPGDRLLGAIYYTNR